MTVTHANHDPPPPERRPLSEHEERALRLLQARAVEDGPGLSLRPWRTTPRWGCPARLARPIAPEQPYVHTQGVIS